MAVPVQITSVQSHTRKKKCFLNLAVVTNDASLIIGSYGWTYMFCVMEIIAAHNSSESIGPSKHVCVCQFVQPGCLKDTNM